jgi:hypothetical protein
LKRELESKDKDFETLKKQAHQQGEEYNRIADEHNELERQLRPEAKKSV